MSPCSNRTFVNRLRSRAIASIGAERSTPVTTPPGYRPARRKATSPVPHARSTQTGYGLLGREPTRIRFHAASRPRDIARVATSYRDAASAKWRSL